uniref:Uncharacterized protein n=1 Tax=Amphimedon queenslandica TaxID=400682 RepID=A0A1X7UVJ3_AMPQE
MDIITPIISPSDEDPFVDCNDDIAELRGLVSQVQQTNSCSVEELIQVEENIPVYANIASENWEEDFFGELDPANEEDAVTQSNDDEDEVDTDVLSSSQQVITSYSDAVKYLEDVSAYLENKGHTSEANECFISAIGML